MTSTEIVVIIGGLVIGYWIVGYFFSNRSESSGRTRSKRAWEEAEQRKGSQYRGSADKKTGDDNHIRASWYQVLEVAEDASLEQIVMAYKRRIRLYHPDKVTQMGREIRELAELKSKEINAAYDYAIKRQNSRNQ